MGVKELRRELAVRRIWESVIATVMGGLILWSVTSSKPQPAPATEGMTVAVTPTVQPEVALNVPPLDTSTTIENPAPVMGANLSIPASIPGPAVPIPPPKGNLLSYSTAVGSILLYENFSHYREGEATDWGPNTYVKMGLDHRNWLVSNMEGTHPVGCRIRLPGEFHFECRYSAYIPEVTRGILVPDHD